MAENDLIPPAQAAEQLGLAKSTLSRQIKAGLVRSHAGRVRLSEVVEDRARNVRHRTPPASDGASSSFARARADKEASLAQLRRIEVAVKDGRLVDAATVHRKVFELARGERDALLNWPSRVVALIAAEIGADQVKLAVVLEKHVREYLAERAEPHLRLAG